MFESVHDALKQAFGFDEFRPLQEEAVTAASEKKDVLVVVPTGAGKSLTFQLPAAMGDGVALIISPLVALMKDQVDALNQKPIFEALGCAFLNSSQSQLEQRNVLTGLCAGTVKLLYVAPERFRSPKFMDVLASVKLSLFVVDEAHCISEWGHDFRPDYLMLGDIIEQLGRPTVMAVTATATARVQEDIISILRMREPVRLVGGFNRPNLHFSVQMCKGDSHRRNLLRLALPKLAAGAGCGLIYCATRDDCREIGELAAEALAPYGLGAAYFHAGLPTAEKTEIQRAFMAGELKVLVATNAFGMGIDKSDVRFVIHYTYPETIESYYQEAGRAGRDGKQSHCIILHTHGDQRLREYFIKKCSELQALDYATAHRRICEAADDLGTVTLNSAWWKDGLGWDDEVQCRRVLVELERAGLITRIDENPEDIVVRVLSTEFPDALYHAIATHLAEYLKERYRRLGEMIDYCSSRRCRRRVTLEYFGDPAADASDDLPMGACCDNCDRHRDSAPAAQLPNVEQCEMLTVPTVQAPDEIKTVHDVLQAIEATGLALNKVRLSKVLRGVCSVDVIDHKSNILFGCTSHASTAAVDSFIDGLLGCGLLAEAGQAEYFRISVTSEGYAAWQEKERVRVPWPAAAKPPKPRAQALVAQDIYEWRQAYAQSTGVLPHLILNDIEIKFLAKHRPQSVGDLAMVPGVGAEKAEAYAAGLLPILSAGPRV